MESAPLEDNGFERFWKVRVDGSGEVRMTGVIGGLASLACFIGSPVCSDEQGKREGDFSLQEGYPAEI